MPDVSSALRKGRELAAALMDDTCRVTRATGELVTDPDTGAVTREGSDLLYEGPCRFQIRSGSEESRDSGEQRYRVSSSEVWLPVDATKYAEADQVECVASRFDPALPGRHFRVVAVEEKSHATKRRLHVEEGF